MKPGGVSWPCMRPGIVKAFIVRNEDLAQKLADEIERRVVLRKQEVDVLLGGTARAQKLFEEFSGDYKSWLSTVKESSRDEFFKRNPWMANLP
ncbi:MAG: hypothetical protein ACI4Q3_05955 [Kiritimatiellia bacterium]